LGAQSARARLKFTSTTFLNQFFEYLVVDLAQKLAAKLDTSFGGFHNPISLIGVASWRGKNKMRLRRVHGPFIWKRH